MRNAIATPYRKIASVLLLVAWIGPAGSILSADTLQYLDAPIAKSFIRLKLAADGKALQWDIPETDIDFQELGSGRMFLAPHSVTVTYYALNPLRHSVSASSKKVHDQSATVITNLVSTFLTLVSVVAPGAPGIAEAVKAAATTKSMVDANRALLVQGTRKETHGCDSLEKDLESLKNTLEAPHFSPKAIGSAVRKWADDIDGGFAALGATGSSAMIAGRESVQTSINAWNTRIGDAEKALASIKACADDASLRVPDLQDLPPPAGDEPNKPDADFLSKPPGPRATKQEIEAFRKQVEEYAKSLVKYEKDHPAWRARDEAEQKYKEYLEKKRLADVIEVRRMIATNVLVGGASRRISEMKAIVGKAEEITTQLTEFAKPGVWAANRQGRPTSDYVVLRGVTPTFEQMEEVTVDLVTRSYSVNSESAMFSITESKPNSGKFTIRRFSRFAVEPAVGAVFATVRQPQYAAGTDDSGQTVVRRTDDKTLSVSPSVMVNFVCRCGVSRLNPMIQIGATASKELPAALLGAGFRLFGAGPGSLAIGGGAMFAWIKDLQTLRVDQVVKGGAAAIEADRGYRSRPNVGGYFTIQYQF